MTTITDIKQQFFDSLKRGTGEAYILLKKNQQIDFSDLIIKGAIRNYSYDNQSEGSRADYIYRLIKNSKQKDKIVKSILTKLQSEKNDDFGLYQMCDLAVNFYKAGYAEAKQAVYNRFEKNILEDYAFCGTEAMMELHGVEGVLKVAELVGKILIENPNDYESSWRIDDFQKNNKQIDIYKELEKAASENIFIKAYYNSIKKNKWTVPRYKKIKRLTYELVKEKMESKKFFFLSSGRSSELTELEVEKLANEFLLEKDNQKKELYLRFFALRKFPYEYSPIFKIAIGRNPKNTRLVEYAIESLKHFKSDEIREFAIEKIKSKKNPADYLCLLVSNYKKGDYKLLTEVINRSNDYDYIHSLVSGLIEIYQANPTKECKEPLELMYNKMNCGLHRVDIVEILNENNVLSDKVFKELEFDSDEQIRKLYRRSKNRR